MKKIGVFFLMIVLGSCAGNESYTKAADAQEAAREFVRASLDGNYDKASFYLYKDSARVNEMLLNKWRNDYNHWTQEDKVGHKEASIRVITTEQLNDSSLNYVFSNSYKKDTTTIKVVKANGKWLVDLQEILKGRQR